MAAKGKMTAAQLGKLIGLTGAKEDRMLRNWVGKERVRAEYIEAIEEAVGKQLVKDRSILPTKIAGHIPQQPTATPEEIEQARQELVDVDKNVPVDSPARRRLLTLALDRFLALKIPDAADRAKYLDALLDLNVEDDEDNGRQSSNGDGDAH